MTIHSPFRERLSNNFSLAEDSLKSLQDKIGEIKVGLVKLQEYEKVAEIREIEKQLEVIANKLTQIK